METNLIALIPALPLLGALINLFVGRVAFAGKPPRTFVHTVAIASVFAAFAVSVYLVFDPLLAAFRQWQAAEAGGNAPDTLAGLYQSVWTWIEVGGLKLDLALRIDTLSAVMILIVTGVGTLIHVYSTGYMAHEPRYASYFGYLNLFTGAMLVLVLAESLPVMFIGWEGVGVCSYLLIGFWYDKTANADAGRKAFVVNRIGDCAFLIGMFLLFWATGSLSFSDYQSPEAAGVFQSAFGGGDTRLALWAGLLLFIGACGKSAQIPLYVWLPDAMAGPTPVSALIHAATMVTAGVYMIARLSFLYAYSTTAMAIVAGVGAATALFAAIMAFAQTDLKKVLAYSTVSQLGFMFVAVGVGAHVAGIFHLMTHAFFKAGLFLAAGSVMHAMSNSGDIMKMGGLRKLLPKTHIAFLIYCLAIAGIFPFAGFFSKDEILAGAFYADAEGWLAGYGKVLWLVLTVAATGTAFYMFRLYFLVFGGDTVRCDAETRSHIHESPASMWVPLWILAGLTIVAGFIGLPHLSFIPESALYLANWLDPSIIDFDLPSLGGAIHEAHGSDATTIILMLVALVMGVIGISMAWFFYGNGPSARIARATAGGIGAEIHRVVANKFYVDELYELIVVRPFRWTANLLFEVVDRFLIDLILVNGSAFIVDVSGRVTRWYQNGQVQRYLVGLVIGGALIFYFASRPSVDFTAEQIGPGRVAFTPDIGAGASADGALVEFDFDFDGAPDLSHEFDPRAPEAFEWSFGSAGDYKVRMWATDAVFGDKKEVVKTIHVDDVSASAGALGGKL